MSEDFSDLGNVVLDFAEPAPLDVERPGAIVTIKGRPRPGPRAPVAGVIGSTWPVSGRRKQEFIEGGRIMEPRDIFTTKNSPELNVLDDTAQTSGDIVIVEGDEYEVVQQHKWRRGEFGHYIGSLIRRGKGV